MSIQTVGDLLEQLEGIDPETPLAVAFQPSWPLRGRLAAVTQLPEVVNREEEGLGVLWLAVDPETSYDVNPYAHAECWQGGDQR